MDAVNVKGNVITIDAMGTQRVIAEKIRAKSADYVLAVKENQKIWYNDIKDYFMEKEFQKTIKEKVNYKKTTEKAHRQIETREYYQTGDIRWLTQKKD